MDVFAFYRKIHCLTREFYIADILGNLTITNSLAHIPHIPPTPSVQLWIGGAVYVSRPSSVVTFRFGQLLLESWSSFGSNTMNVNIKMSHKSLVNPLFFIFY